MSKLRPSMYIANLAIAATLLLVCIAVQVLVAFSPRWQALYWADIRDFVQGADGSVYVAQLKERVYRYDASGKYVAAYKTGFMIDLGSGSDVQLAVDSRGRIYLKIESEIRVYTPDWTEYPDERFTGDTCRLSASGHIEDASGYENLLLHDRPVAPGELLFSWRRRTGERKYFRNGDGSILERKGRALIHKSEGGDRPTRFGPPWYIQPFRFLAGLWLPLFWLLMTLLIFKVKMTE